MYIPKETQAGPISKSHLQLAGVIFQNGHESINSCSKERYQDSKKAAFERLSQASVLILGLYQRLNPINVPQKKLDNTNRITYYESE
jgi:hypothetical protein